MKLSIRCAVISFFILVGQLLAPSVAAASESDWVLVGDAGGTTWAVQKSSFYLGKNGAGVPIAVVTGRQVDKSTTRIDLQKWYVPLNACAAGSGKLTTTTLDGQFLYENDYLKGAGSVASDIADFICAVYALELQQQKDKSI